MRIKIGWVILGIILSLCGSSLAADNITVLDSVRTSRTIGTEEVGGVHYYKNVTVNPDGTSVTWNDNTGLGVVAHEHSGHGVIHYHTTGVVADKRVVLVDLSDTTHWPHTAGVSIHIEHLDIQIDSNTTGAYVVSLLFLENCGVTDCDSNVFWHVTGSNAVGNNLRDQINWTSNGAVLKTGTGGTLGEITLNDTNWQTDVGLPSSYIPGSNSTFPGDRDLVMYINRTAGTIGVNVTISYHTHTVDHP